MTHTCNYTYFISQNINTERNKKHDIVNTTVRPKRVKYNVINNF